MLFKLQGKTRHAKNRVREMGENWKEIDRKDTVLFAPGEAGPWLLVEPVGPHNHCNNPECQLLKRGSRWVHETNDTDFIVTKVESHG